MLAVEHLIDFETVLSIVSVLQIFGFEIGVAAGPHLDPRYLLEAADDLGLELDPMTSQMDLTAWEVVRQVEQNNFAAGVVPYSKPLVAWLVLLEILVVSMYYLKQVVLYSVKHPGTQELSLLPQTLLKPAFQGQGQE